MKKMSRSIKEYKDAMDSIKISDSFYKRTETLLNELPEAEIEKKPFYASKKITAGIMAAAACIICIIGIRTVTDLRNENIESSGETGLTEITMETTEQMTAPEIIDSLDEDDAIDEMLIEDDIVAYEDIAEDSVADDAYDTSEYDEGGGTAAETVPQTAQPISGGAGVSSYTGSQESGTVVTSSVPTDGDPETEDVPEDETDTKDGGAVGHSESNAGGIDNVPLLKDISFENVTVEITPYFDMDNIVSGESSVKKNGTECQWLIEFISEISENSHEISNYSFKSLFSLQITDETIGVNFYSIYVTDLNTIVITKHGADGQKRYTYGVSADKYTELKKNLFLMFGKESDYELFENLVSGK